MAMPRDDDTEQDTKADLTPMIDIIFLLLVFLILTTKFVTDEEVIGQLLAAQGPIGPPPIEAPPQLNLTLYPGGLPTARSLEALDAFASARSPTGFESVLMRSGGDEFLVDPSADPEQQLAALSAFVHAMLGRVELVGVSREQQDAITIHCFSGLPWRYALWTYDAVRAYELDVAGHSALLQGHESDRPTRTVSFAPPRIRNSSQFERGRELKELLVVR